MREFEEWYEKFTKEHGLEYKIDGLSRGMGTSVAILTWFGAMDAPVENLNGDYGYFGRWANSVQHKNVGSLMYLRILSEDDRRRLARYVWDNSRECHKGRLRRSIEKASREAVYDNIELGRLGS